jgi:predicted kinase
MNKEQLIYITIGLPGSGKTTWSSELERTINKNYPNDKCIRINNDDIREIFSLNKDGSKQPWSPKFEKEVQSEFNSRMKLSLDLGWDVILDNTYLNPKTYQKLRENLKQNWPHVKVIVQDFTSVPLETCIERDENRKAKGERSVGVEVIMRLWSQFLKPHIIPPPYIENVPSTIIVDLDGTLAIVGDRNVYDASNCDVVDTPNPAIVNMLQLYKRNSQDVVISFMSGRMDKYKDPTLRFLKKCGFNVLHGDWNHNLFMRKTGDARHDYIVKRELYETHIKGKYNVLFCLDDRPSIVRLWKTLGLMVFNCGDSYEF